MPTNKFIKDGVTYTGNTITEAHRNYKNAVDNGTHKKENNGSVPEDLNYTKLPQHHLNANDKALAASYAPQGSPLKNMLK